MFTHLVIYTPNVKKTIARKEKPDLSDFERYADVITAYREFLKTTALADDIYLPSSRKKVPVAREDLVKWVQHSANLDFVAESFRRTCSGYVSTSLLFCVRSGKVYLDWPAVLSMLLTLEDVLRSVIAYMDIGGKGALSDEVEDLDEILTKIKEIRESVTLKDLLASLPSGDLRGALD